MTPKTIDRGMVIRIITASMLKGQVLRGRALAPLCLVAIFSTLSGVSAAPAADATVRVTVHTTSGTALRDFHVALVALDQSPGHPAAEMISATGYTNLTVAPGAYALITSANGHETDLRNVRVTAGGDNDVSVELKPSKAVTGFVLDTEGNPIAGAQVAQAPAASAPALAEVSAAALNHLRPSMVATTGADGAWRLDAAPFPLVVEAKGFAPAWKPVRRGDEGRPIDVVLQKGASLQVTLDRADPSIVISAIPSAAPEEGTGIPPRFQSRVFGKEATALSLEWPSLAAGEYKLLASYPDPLRFGAPVEVGRVSLAAGSIVTARVTLPPARPAATRSVALLLPRQTDPAGLRAFVRSPAGSDVAKYSTLNALGGPVVFVDTAARPADVFLTTRTELFTVAADAGRKGLVALEPALVAKGEARLRILSGGEGVVLPAVANVAFSSCSSNEQVALPVKVGNDGVLSFPYAVPCHGVTVNLQDVESVGVSATLRPGEEKWLGEFKVGAAASAEVHVTYASIPVAGVTVRASVMRDRQKVPVGEAVADDQGVAVLNALPAGDVLFEARLGDTKQVGSATTAVESGKRAVVDPLEIPEPASLVVTADFDPGFKVENPGAAILGMVLEREGTERPKDTRNADFQGQDPEATFDDLVPGKWQITAIVKVEDAAQPLSARTVELKSGDDERVSLLLKPEVFTGQVLSRGQGVQGSVGISDQPGPQAIRRDVHTTAEGKFKVALPKEGPYRVNFRRSVKADPIDLGAVLFDSASRVIRIELPDTTLAVRVRSDDAPVADAAVVATLRNDSLDGAGVARLTRRAKTDEQGLALFEDLSSGPWALEASEPRSGRRGEKVANVGKSGRFETTLDLNAGKTLKGAVVDEHGAPAAAASVDCIFAGAAGLLRAVHGVTDAEGAFSFTLPDPAPPRLDCGVATASGAIGAFATAPGSDLQFALPQAAGSMTIADWGDRVIPDRFWLIAPDGRIFNLSWAARKFGRAWSPLTIARVPSGSWRVVRVDSAAALNAIATGMARSLPTVADVRLSAGQNPDIRIQDSPVARR